MLEDEYQANADRIRELEQLKHRLDEDIKVLRVRTDEDKKDVLDRIGSMNQEINQAVQENRKKKDFMVLRGT